MRLDRLSLVIAGVQQLIQVNVAVLDVLSKGGLHELIDLEIRCLNPLAKHLLDLLVLSLQYELLLKGTLALI